MTALPGRPGPIAVEQRVERVDVFRVVHPHDPFAPGEIIDGVDQRDRGELPVQDGDRSERAGIEQEVLRPEFDRSLLDALPGDGALRAREAAATPAGGRA
jgi:hypothetical protein